MPRPSSTIRAPAVTDTALWIPAIRPATSMNEPARPIIAPMQAYESTRPA